MLEKFIRPVQTGLGLLLIASVLLNCANIAGRYFFGRSIIGADELEIYAMIAITFIGLFCVTWRQAHLRMDVMTRNLAPAPKLALDIIERLLTLAVSWLLLCVSSEYVMRMYQVGAHSENAEIPMWIPHAAVTVGTGLTGVVCIAQIVGTLRSRRRVHSIPADAS